MRELAQFAGATLKDLRLSKCDFHHIAATNAGLSDRNNDDDDRIRRWDDFHVGRLKSRRITG
jgi:hypothetical protein